MKKSHPLMRNAHPPGPGESCAPVHPHPTQPATPELDAAAKLGVVALGFVAFVVMAVLMRRGVVSVLSAVFVIGAGIAVARVIGVGRPDVDEGARRDGR